MKRLAPYLCMAGLLASGMTLVLFGVTYEWAVCPSSRSGGLESLCSSLRHADYTLNYLGAVLASAGVAGIGLGIRRKSSPKGLDLAGAEGTQPTVP
jgi:hypothetical protein